MILPDKNINLEYSILNCGAVILGKVVEPQTISLLWEKIRNNEEVVSFDKFLITLDFLFMINAIKLEAGLVMRCKYVTFNKK